ncbi:MAG: glycosyl hydrolase family 28-related protein [Pseudomonadota bacterium]
MNKTITDGVVFTPATFADGLTQWSSEDGRPGQDTYDGTNNAAFVPADQNFGGCLEMQKINATTKLRHVGQTPVEPGCYLQITVRIKLISGAFPLVRIAGWPGRGTNTEVIGVPQYGPAIQLTTYGEVVTLKAVIGSGNRGGVDMVWGATAEYGHFGIDLTGPNGGIVRIDDIEIEDVSGAFVTQQLGAVDVRDYGAMGDGITDDHDAFEAADTHANGREILVPAGTFYLGNTVTLENPVRFVGTITMPDSARLTLLKSFNLPTYIDAFGDEVTGFKKAVQSLLNFNDHDSLDMGGRRVQLSEPIDMQTAVDNRDTFNIRRVIRNGQFQADPSPAWDSDVVQAQATYTASNAKTLTNVQNVANIARGSLVEGNGVGREVYVADVNVADQTLTLTQPLYDAEGTQSYTFTRFKYMLDFSGFAQMSLFNFADIDFQCQGNASAVMIARDGISLQFRDCYFSKPKDRAITSIGSACQGMAIDRCQFISDESPLNVEDRVSIGFNSNKNDLKVRDCRIVHLKHFGVVAGSGNLFTGNHWFHGDTTTDGVRKGGIIFTSPNIKTLITGNYIDNNFIEWTNEHDATPDFANQFSFGGLTLTGNIFTVNDVAPWFKYLVIKPHGINHTIFGLTITGNVFRALNGAIDRVEGVDTTFADLDYTRTRNVVVQGNTYHGVSEPMYNPCVLSHTEGSDSSVWNVNFSSQLPFGGRARTVESIVCNNRILSGATTVYENPYVLTNQSTGGQTIRLGWSKATRGTVTVTARMDNPL